MIKTAIKHFIYEQAIASMFDNLYKNFMFARHELNITEGKRFSYIRCIWMKHEIIIYNAKIDTINCLGILGTFIQITSTEPIQIINIPILDSSTQDIYDVVESCLYPCRECYLVNMFYIRNNITISKSQIKEIIV